MTADTDVTAEPMTAENAQKFLLEAAEYFSRRDTGGEDMAHWSNVYNADNCRHIAATIDHVARQHEALVRERDTLRRRINGFGGWPAMAQDYEEKNKYLREERDSLRSQLDRAKAALQRIERWEMPATGETWDGGTPMSYAACYGSNGERDVIREIARKTLNAPGDKSNGG